MTPLQQLENRIRELVPSLQELSFGCEVKWKSHTEIYLNKIIGHPIQLHHVLQSIEEKMQRRIYKAISYDLDVEHHSNSGDKYYTTTKWRVLKLLTLWNLQVEGLSGQSEETINLLLEILN